MTVITITQFRKNVYETMGRAEAGEKFSITRHGKVVAEIVPKEGLRRVSL